MKNKKKSRPSKKEDAENKDQKDPLQIKEKTPEERKQSHIEGVIKTAVASVIGIIAGIAAYFALGSALDTPWYSVIIIVAILAFYLQRAVLPVIKIDTKQFGLKDWLYVEFLVLDFFLVTWILMLN
ncbi:conserved hypothetical protein [Methanosalsum zhilinae DSM 4017]|uniref:Uncharacterized protein n=1 Tax=Methanosalsum zhilinae (strain DSM 4017 / NBRC 107636 / OCM 62 / WeN5) TaxID=679901 RepID=F7XMT5_METZD|nr:hypothetical protein [Methanosalsum zhilinae]AEH59952.1 conserved hypothetical protein [Methanosalsum zhilinae DSM 4017]